MNIVEAFGIVLRNRRKIVNISQEQLALSCDLDRTYISLLERGKRNATVDTLFRLCEILNISPGVFIKDVENLINNKNH